MRIERIIENKEIYGFLFMTLTLLNAVFVIYVVKHVQQKLSMQQLKLNIQLTTGMI